MNGQISVNRFGFTLVELLVVVAIIGILVGLALPAVQTVREASRRTECSNRLRQVALATQNFESSHRHFPSGINSPSHADFPSMSWLTQILPYIENSNLWSESVNAYKNNPSPFSPHIGLQSVVPVFSCPSNPGADVAQFTNENRLVALTSYLGVNGTDYTTEDGIFYKDSQTRIRDISDGTSNTLMMGERPPSPDYWYGWWYAGSGQNDSGSPDMLLGVSDRNDGARYAEHCPSGPYEYGPGDSRDQCHTFHYWSNHGLGANFAFADGAVRFIAYDAYELMPALGTKNGGEIAQLID